MSEALQVTSPMSTTMAGKRGRSADGRGSVHVIVDQSSSDGSTPSPPQLRHNVKMPPYLDKSQADIAQTFQELEWKQRFRLFDAMQNPETSPYKMDKSLIVASRNRYANVQPWDASRIKLKEPIGGSDYVNASPVVLKTHSMNAAHIVDTKYIASHGPKDGQFSHFWRMVHQETVGDVGVIIMLTQLIEQNKEKCAQYFPASLDEPVIILPREGNDSATLTGTTSIETTPSNTASSPTDIDTVELLHLVYDESLGCDVRTLRLNIDSQPKTVLHYLFRRWPDFGKPEAADRRALIELSRRTMSEARESPRIVHCSAGVGRTGTWIALDHLIREVEAGRLLEYTGTNKTPVLDDDETSDVPTDKSDGRPNPSDISTWGRSGPPKANTPTREEFEKDEDDLIFDTVNTLREQRVMMVVNEVQLQFLYEAVREAVLEKYRHTAQGAQVSGGTIDDAIDVRRPKIRRVVTGETDVDASEAETEIMDPAAASDAISDTGLDGKGKTAVVDPYSSVSDEVVRESMKQL